MTYITRLCLVFLLLVGAIGCNSGELCGKGEEGCADGSSGRGLPSGSGVVADSETGASEDGVGDGSTTAGIGGGETTSDVTTDGVGGGAPTPDAVGDGVGGGASTPVAAEEGDGACDGGDCSGASADGSTGTASEAGTDETAEATPDSLGGGPADVTPFVLTEEDPCESYLEAEEDAYCHVETSEEGRHDYTLFLGGNVDMENATTRLYSLTEVHFQPDIALIIENVGDTPIVNPHIVMNDQGRWFTLQGMLEEFTRGAETEQDKVYFLWENLRRNRYHEKPLFTNTEPHDPVKLFNVYGFNLCGQIGNANVSLLLAMGLEGSYLREMVGHVQAEAFVNGALQFIDVDQACFYLDRENEYPISGNECAYDAGLVRREQNYGPAANGGTYRDSSITASVFGPDDHPDSRMPVSGHEIAYTLRRHEKVIYRWDNIGKIAAGSPDQAAFPAFWGNSAFEFVPKLDLDIVEQEAEDVQQLAKSPPSVGNCQLSGIGQGSLTYAMEYPYVICGGRAQARFYALNAGDTFAIQVSTDGNAWQDVWTGSGQGSITADVTLDDALDVHNSPAKYQYLLRVALNSSGPDNGAGLCSLSIHTDVMAAPLALPRLQVGDNKVEYTDETVGPRDVRITHVWRENHDIVPLDPPDAPIYPPDNSQLRESIVEFSWPANEGASKYHIRVSRRPDFAYPYRPGLDVITPEPYWSVPFSGIYAPDTTYYWHVRTRDENGVWGPWSDTWTFTWQGPRVPLNVRLDFDGKVGTLRWEPNFRGSRPVRYAVFGSDELGFTAHRDTYYQPKLGNIPPNFLAETADTSMVVISENNPSENMNKSFYRVIAIDEYGTEGGESEYAEAPHPFIYSTPSGFASVGEEYRYQAQSLTSIGDLQMRNSVYDYYDIEVNTFELVQAPVWLQLLDPACGTFAGTPGLEDAGAANVTIRVCNQFLECDEQTFELTVLEPADAGSSGAL